MNKEQWVEMLNNKVLDLSIIYNFYINANPNNILGFMEFAELFQAYYSIEKK